MLNRQTQPVVILALVAALVLVTGLWAKDRASRPDSAADGSSATYAGQTFQWKLVTTWPKNLPGLGKAPETFARMVGEMSGGRLTVRVYGAGEVVPAMGVFDAVSGGVAQVGHGASYYWKGKIPASVFFTAIPFGMTAQEMNGWLHYGGGEALWRETYEPFGVVPFAGGSTGVQMAGWFNRELTSAADLNGLKMRIPGLAGEVFSAAGGTAVNIPGGDIYTSMQTGVIDAVEWVGPYNDAALGLQEVAEYYYYPGWHEPGAMLEFIVNREALLSLPEDLQAIVRYAARATNQDMLDEFTARNNASLQRLIDKHGTAVRALPDDVIDALYRNSRIVMQRLVEGDAMARKVYQSYKQFHDDVRAYHRISEQGYINVRSRVYGESIPGVSPAD